MHKTVPLELTVSQGTNPSDGAWAALIISQRSMPFVFFLCMVAFGSPIIFTSTPCLPLPPTTSFAFNFTAIDLVIRVSSELSLLSRKFSDALDGELINTSASDVNASILYNGPSSSSLQVVHTGLQYPGNTHPSSSLSSLCLPSSNAAISSSHHIHHQHPLHHSLWSSPGSSSP